MSCATILGVMEAMLGAVVTSAYSVRTEALMYIRTLLRMDNVW